MIFQYPWAWIGAAAIAVPILVHLLTRQRVDRTPFPTLRLLPALPLTTVRRYRLTDLALLAARCGVLLAATWALAQPYVVTATRRHDTAIARAIVLDTSASMSRPSTTGARAIDAARATIAALEPRADATTTIETARLNEGIVGAAAWLDRASGQRELVIASDFQRGAIGPDDLARLARDIAVRRLKIDVASNPGGTALAPTLQLLPDRTDVRWTATAVSGGAQPAETSVEIFASPDERPYAEAALQSARQGAVPMSQAVATRIAIVFPGAPERAALRAAAHDLDQAWMFDLVARIRRDPVVARFGDGRPFAAPAVAPIGNTPTLALFLEPADRVLHAAVVAAAERNLIAPDTLDELEPESISAATLAEWADPRARSAVAETRRRGVPSDASDGRWFWALALVLLGVETIMRRPARPAIETIHERAA